jgi:hypothetical protein
MVEREQAKGTLAEELEGDDGELDVLGAGERHHAVMVVRALHGCVGVQDVADQAARSRAVEDGSQHRGAGARGKRV